MLLRGQIGKQRLLLVRGQVQVEGTDDGVSVVNGERPHVGHGFDLLGALLDLCIGHGQAKLLDTALDGVPASQPRRKVDVWMPKSEGFRTS
ncbi:hypothetical protein BN1708_005861 [Verticillium longisporum]|uniref:Uncharacterized protein n=1 Tax=Verticillium longisporum TaxID=100787 RepID=A0A0G4MEJ4_VERLO|nr:hypothetical protein BN1708_012204 [Verticillium longisporum]CRK32616.1 hypothetical protein BN1708_005861 [Verticillium longisporum]